MNGMQQLRLEHPPSSSATRQASTPHIPQPKTAPATEYPSTPTCCSTGGLLHAHVEHVDGMQHCRCIVKQPLVAKHRQHHRIRRRLGGRSGTACRSCTFACTRGGRGGPILSWSCIHTVLQAGVPAVCLARGVLLCCRSLSCMQTSRQAPTMPGQVHG